MEPPSIEFSWKCICRLPYRRFIQQPTKKRKKNDSQKQPSKLKEYAAVKIVGRRTSNNTPRSQIWSSKSYISVLWVELRLLNSIFALKSCNYVEANRKFMQFLKKCATFEGYQRIAENDIMESKRENYRRIVNVRTFFLSCTYEVTTRIYKNQLPYLESEIEINTKNSRP